MHDHIKKQAQALTEQLNNPDTLNNAQIIDLLTLYSTLDPLCDLLTDFLQILENKLTTKKL